MINWKIDIADLINIILFVIAGVLGYCLIDRIQKEDSRFAVIETLADNLKSISPGLDIHYTNEISKNGKSVNFKVYIKNVTAHDVYIGSPYFQYHLEDGGRKDERTDDILGFNNMLAPGVDLCISFEKPAPETPVKTVEIGFQAETLAAYSNTLLLAVSELSDDSLKENIEKSINKNISKEYSYEEKLYLFDKNPIWKEFCDKPK